jgi:hypothetical protein
MWDGYKTKGICSWCYPDNVARCDTIVGKVIMKQHLSKLSSFYLFLALEILLSWLVSEGYVLYICKNVWWLAWTAQPPYPTVFDFLLLCGIPFFFGKRSTFLTGRDVLLYGMGLNLGLGIFGNIIAVFNWKIFLMKCMPDEYTYFGFQIMMIASWLALPLGAALGGITAWIGHKWSANRMPHNRKLTL